ncbi:hypothetical protein [Paenibacillus sp. J2TS4]|uniref:hypothetical protein n=1 Tax=Paenibacillus sp. J2TS4 TaxID=2807194 RepID=UPI001BCDE722|nr:hypothetical protein [Paenibacillus sp. J2TS4]
MRSGLWLDGRFFRIDGANNGGVEFGLAVISAQSIHFLLDIVQLGVAEAEGGFRLVFVLDAG